MNFKIAPKHKLGQFIDPNTGYKVSDKTKKFKQNSLLPQNRVDVTAWKTEHGEDIIDVKVFSTHGNGSLAAKASIRPGQATDGAHLKQMIEAAGGSGAEHLCQMYGDTLDPSTCAKYALELGIEAIKKIAEANEKGIIITT